MSDDLLGSFEHQVLLAVLRLGSEAYTVPVVDEIQALTAKAPAPAAVYTTLRRLEDRGLVTSAMSPAPDRGRPRRVFTLEAPGLAALRHTKDALFRYWDGLAVLDEA